MGSEGIEFLRTYLKGRRLKPSRPIFDVSRRTVEYIVQKASTNAGLKPHVTPHKLRSYFSTRLKLAGCPDTQVEYWMGHTVPYRGAYFVPPIEEQRKIYRKYEWSLSIGGVE
ncbi:MAG: tyrosine-type recombinase/integrase [Candidatus Freyarchaeota archaeon]